jgi:hypothetical protein
MLARRIRMKPLPLAAAAALLVSVLSGCNSGHRGPATNGPLGSGGDPTHAEVCEPARVGQALTFGLEQFTNRGRTLVVLNRVTLWHPHHERLVGSYAVPGQVPIGAGFAWPPHYAGISPAWKHRQPVHGFRLAPGKTFTMVLGVAGTRLGTATSRGMLLYYHNTSTGYVTKDELAMTVAAGKKTC